MSERAAVERDYRALRDSLGAFWLPRDAVALEGPDAASYLQGQLSQDVATLAEGRSVDTFVLAPDGKVDVFARVSRLAEELFVLDVDGGFGEQLVARLARFKLRSRFDLVALDWSCLALRGPQTPSAGLDAPIVAPVEWYGWRGLDLLAPSGTIRVPDGVPVCGEGAWEAARIESGVPVMGREITPSVIPAETGLVGRTVSFTKGCFTGQELVARIDARGGHVPHHLVGLVADSADPARLPGLELAVAGRERPVGRVTSAAWCPGLDATGALAYVHRSVEVPGTVRVGSGDDTAGWAEVRPLPLVPAAADGPQT